MVSSLVSITFDSPQLGKILKQNIQIFQNIDPNICLILFFFRKGPGNSFSTTFCVWFFKKNVSHILLYSKQTFVDLEDVLKMSSTRLQRYNFTSSKTSWRLLEDILQRRLEDVLKTCLKDKSWRRLEDMSLRHVLKTSWRHVLKTSWRYYGDKQNTYWEYLYTYLGITNLNVYLTSLYFTNLYLTILRRIQNVLIRTQ